jgi:hypothetical protein
VNLSKLGGSATSFATIAVVVAGFVVLALKGLDTGAFLGLVGPIISGLYVAGKVDARSDVQDQALTTITRQTNGVLDARIREGVAAALAARDAPAAGAADSPAGDNPELSPGGDNPELSSNGRGVAAPTEGA